MRNSRRKRGFTLVEAMIAMVILSAATAAVILPFSTGAALNSQGVLQTIATRLAADRMEEIVNAGYYAASGYNNFYEPAGAVWNADYSSMFTYPAYSKFSRLSRCTGAILAGETVYLVTVSVYYNSAGLDTPMVQLSTIVGR